MALFRGRMGAFYAPDNSSIEDSTDTTLAISEGGSSGIFSISNAAVRVVRTLPSDAVVGDYEGTGGITPTAIRIATAEFDFGASNPAGVGAVGTGKIITLVKAGGFFDWRVNANMATEEVTEFGDTWTERVTTIKNWSGSCSSYWQDNNFTVDAAAGLIDIDGDSVSSAGSSFTVVFYITTGSGASNRLVGKAVMAGFEVSATVGGIVEKTVNFEGDGPLYYRSETYAE